MGPCLSYHGGMTGQWMPFIWLFTHCVHIGDFSSKEVDELLSESIHMKQLSHPNVMSLLGVCVDAGPSPYIVMPFIVEGSLLNYLKKRRSMLVVTEREEENIVSSPYCVVMYK